VAAPTFPSASIAPWFFDIIPSPLRAPEVPILRPDLTIRVARSGFSPAFAVEVEAAGGGEMGAGAGTLEIGGRVRDVGEVVWDAGDGREEEERRCGREAKYSSRREKKASCNNQRELLKNEGRWWTRLVYEAAS
jgi:hypothetical protein